jgi:hypothetical protein
MGGADAPFAVGVEAGAGEGAGAATGDGAASEAGADDPALAGVDSATAVADCDAASVCESMGSEEPPQAAKAMLVKASANACFLVDMTKSTSRSEQPQLVDLMRRRRAEGAGQVALVLGGWTCRPPNTAIGTP